MSNTFKVSEKTPVRLVQVSLAFSFVNFLVNGLNGQTLLAFLAFTITVYFSGRIALLLGSPGMKMLPEAEGLKLPLLGFCALQIAIVTLTYSWLFGAFYLSVFAIYMISPYDRDWLLGSSKVVMVGNKIEYRKEAM